MAHDTAGAAAGAAPAALEMVTVGTSVALFRADNHAVALLNEAAAGLCRKLLEGSLPATAGAAAAGDGPTGVLLAELGRAGFLAPSAAAVSRSTPSRSGSDIAIGCAAAPCLGHYRIGDGPVVAVAVGASPVAGLLAASLAPLAVAARSQPTATVTLAPTPGGLGLWRNGTAIGLDLAPADARRMTLQATLMALHPEGSIAAILHASTVAIDGRAVVLAGSTGSGKSTLALALAAAGARWLADDFTPLDRSGLEVRPFPVAASVKSGSWPLLAGRLPDLGTCAVHTPGDRSVRYLDPRPSGPGGGQPPLPKSIGIAAIVLPRLAPAPAPNGPWKAVRLAPEATLARLLASGSEVVGLPRALAPLARLADRVPAFELPVAGLDAGVDAVNRLLAGTCAMDLAS